MYLLQQLQERASAGRPVRVGLIGAGKFGSMFLSQAPATDGLEVAVIADLEAERAPRGVPGGRLERRPCGPDALHRRRAGSDCRRNRRSGRGGDRRPGCRDRPRACGVRRPQARRDGERRSRRACRAAAGGRGARGRRGVHAGVRRSAGAHLRAGRVGARVRLRGRRGGQGHEAPAGLSRLDAGHRMGPLRAHSPRRPRRPA